MRTWREDSNSERMEEIQVFLGAWLRTGAASHQKASISNPSFLSWETTGRCGKLGNLCFLLLGLWELWALLWAHTLRKRDRSSKTSQQFPEDTWSFHQRSFRQPLMWQVGQFFHTWVSYSVQTDLPGPLSFQSSMIKGIEGSPKPSFVPLPSSPC